MKDRVLFVLVLIAVAVSIFFTFQRSFVTHDFVMINSEEEGDEEAIEEESTLPELETPTQNEGEVVPEKATDEIPESN